MCLHSTYIAAVLGEQCMRWMQNPNRTSARNVGLADKATFTQTFVKNSKGADANPEVDIIRLPMPIVLR